MHCRFLAPTALPTATNSLAMPPKPIDWTDPCQWPADFYQDSQRPGAWQGGAILFFSAMEKKEKQEAEADKVDSTSKTMPRARSRSRSPLGPAAK